MASVKSLLKAITVVFSGLAILIVGAFMIGAVARLWLPKDKNRKGYVATSEFDDAEKTG